MLLPVFLLAPALAAAQTAERGYVVRADSATVWLDLIAADGAAAGRAFEVYAEGPELKHPVTGALLGRVRDAIASGTIREVSEKFSTGALSSPSAAVKAGQRARLLPIAAPAATEESRAAQAGTRAPKSMSASVPYEVNAMAVGKFSREGRLQLALASENTVRIYDYPPGDLKPLSETAIPGTGVRIVGLETADFDDDGGAEIFVSVFDGALGRFETRVLTLEDGKWRQTADLPFLTRAYQDERGKRALATQQLVDDGAFPFGALYPLAYQDGKYSQGRPALNLPRADWLYGFTTAGLGQSRAVLTLTSTHHLRVQLDKGAWSTPDDDYGQTPVRARWRDRLLEFAPPLVAAYGPSGFEALFAVRNIAALGGLAGSFGAFSRGELVAARWNGLGLDSAWRAALPGCAQGLVLIDADGRRELAVAVRGSAGQSSIWTFDL